MRRNSVPISNFGGTIKEGICCYLSSNGYGTMAHETFRHLDCASLYQNEKEVGQAIKEAMKDFNISRNELFITSKLWNTHHDPEDVEPAFRKSLKDLGLDYLDLYLIHWPVAFERGNLPFPHGPDGKIKVGLIVFFLFCCNGCPGEANRDCNPWEESIPYVGI